MHRQQKKKKFQNKSQPKDKFLVLAFYIAMIEDIQIEVIANRI